ncbi:MAG: crossover junction endodeoxyribonuclease RuvC [Bacteroidetes bacterium]|uniref:Crossover junction endodeoxyribonuclease RuvC n=1 Tax=Candidatus Pullibacteroides excrementavium TaxID=2840905 RepID=A0A9D9DQG9_9BACT|nr:crossover junction endodeoxyribonuclease RuvC [Candidatus Pullibacteroides excrementavium]
MQEIRKGKTILGIDPGTRLMGHGVVKTDGQHFECKEMGVLDLRKEPDPLRRLELILEEVLRLIEAYAPQYLSIESPFYGKNVQALLKLGRAQGVAIAASLSKGLEVHEYSPREIKQSLTGKGSASKEQVCAMALRLTGMQGEAPKHLDATDALAAAICHGIHSRFDDLREKAAPEGLSPLSAAKTARKKSSWAEFLSSHPDRIK